MLVFSAQRTHNERKSIMLYFVDSKGAEKGWHVGNRKPLVNQCVEVQADGDELMYILNNMRNLPHSITMSVIVWKGELAQFIYDNI
jgi:hypothetical protein